ncbi:MAG: Asp-tRNA(Asn)/Glu-tRNA(Gln) amidotransferase GatCAB subunit C, partial [Oscillospiraceae bacterium]|nr:Asp-tRNA(Asn)/Glu-tRNA(Gln) amidotransferase GatCAB subunit C [Oscillospiraceae bacterium]
PQAPQPFKQLLMAAGVDQYFQSAPCFRAEDARGDRTPGEFYQLDMEMAFATQEDVLGTLEDVLIPVFRNFGKYERVSAAPLRRIPFKEAMERYGSDKPDLRVDLELQDVTEVVRGCGFGPFDSPCVKAVVVHDFNQGRKWIDKLLVDVEVQTGNKVCWVKVDENGSLTGGISKFLVERQAAFIEALGLQPGSFVCMAAGKKLTAQKTAGVARNMLGKRIPGHFDENQYAMCWIVNFPMYEQDEETGEVDFCHNPFSMPQGGMQTLIDAEGDMEKILAINADQYDLVVNGYETASGAVRNHSPEIMIKAFSMVGRGEEEVKRKFPAMYNAFTYGAPPHAGAAPGIDRIVMLLTGEESIREVITFPMNQKAQDVMMGAPSVVDQKQLDDVHIAIVPEE